MRFDRPGSRNRRPRSRSRAGYLLFEVILAVTVFSVAFVGLIQVVNQTARTSNEFAFDRLLDDGLAAILAEAKQREIGRMTLQTLDEVTGISYRTEVEPMALATGNGKNLRDLHRLRATATCNRAGREETRIAELWIYRPRSDAR